MHESDLKHVNLLLSKSFTHARIQSGHQSTRVPLCRIEFLKMYLVANPSASFVIENGGKIAAYCFSRLWGSLAWIGPLGVLPAEENNGYGKQIVSACVEQLKAQGATTIGLEMSAYSGRNLGFYAKLGFVPGQPVVDMIRKVSAQGRSVPTKLEFTELSKVPKPELANRLSEVQKLSEKIEPGLDYTQEIQLASEFGFGDGCVLSDGSQLAGFVLAHTEPYSQEEERRFLKINALQLSSDLQVDFLDSTLDLIEPWAREKRLHGIYVRVPTRYTKTFQFFLNAGFKIINTDIRLTLKDFGQKDHPERVNISKWQ